MNELKPCPFCGGEPIINMISFDYLGVDRRFFYVACLDCMVEQRNYAYEFRKDAVEAWNRRVKDETP